MKPVNRFRLAYVGFFLYLGTWGPHWGIFLKETHGFDDALVGQLYTCLVATLIVSSLTLTRLADAFRWRRRMLRILTFMAAGTLGTWLVVGSPEQAFLLAVGHGLLVGPQIPMLDASAIEYLGSERRRYGRLRVFGTLGFGLAAVSVSMLSSGHPARVAMVFTAAMALFHLTTWLLPDSQSREEAEPSQAQAPRRFPGLLRMRAVRLLALAAFLHGTGFAAYELFARVHFEQVLGFEGWQVGAAYGAALGCELLCLIAAPRLLGRFPARGIGTLALGITVLRWVLMGSLEDPALLIPLQVAHGASYALWYVASIHLLGTAVGPRLVTTGQGLFFVSFATGFATGGSLAGWVRSAWSPHASFWVAAGIATVATAVFASQRR